MNNQTINEIKKRDIDKVLVSLTILSQDIFFNDSKDYIRKRTIYTIIGCNINGFRKYITSIFEDEYTKTSDWYDLLLSFKNRGLEHIFYILMPNNKNIKAAFDLTFKNITYFYSCFDIFNKLYHYIPCTYSNNVIIHLKDIYLASNIDEFNLKLNDLYKEYNSFPFIVDIIKQELSSIPLSILDYPIFIRKHVISYHFIREFLKKLRVIANSENYFFKLEDFEIKLLPTIKIFEARMHTSKKNWNSIISYLYKDYKYLLINVL